MKTRRVYRLRKQKKALENIPDIVFWILLLTILLFTAKQLSKFFTG